MALTNKLEAALLQRDIHKGFSLLDATLGAGTTIDVASPGGLALLLATAQWTDLGYRSLEFFEDLATKLPKLDRAQLPVLDFIRLRMTEAYRCLASEQLGEAIDTLELVLKAALPALPHQLLEGPGPAQARRL